MEAPPKKKLVAKVNFNANIYEPPAPSPTYVTANVVRAKVSSSSVNRVSSSMVNGGHSRNNSLAKMSTPSRSQTGQFDDFKGLLTPTTRVSAPPSSVGKSAGYGMSSNSLLLSPESSSSPSSPLAANRDRQPVHVNAQQSKGIAPVTSPLSIKFRAYQARDEPSPISPPTSPRAQSLAMLSEPVSSHTSTNLIPQRKRVVSSIRITSPKITATKLNGTPSSGSPLGHRARTPSASFLAGVTNRSRATVTARAIPQQILSPSQRLGDPTTSQSPTTSTLSSRSSASMASSSLSGLSPLSISTATDGESDLEKDQFDEERVDTPQAELDEDSIFAEEARSNRKILDLEISNKSLLTVNTMLEATKLRQSREIKELRRKLRETRHMPSRPLYTNSETLSPTTSDLSLPNHTHSNSSPSSEEDEEAEPDLAYERITRLVEGLLYQAHRAIERTIDDCMPVSTNTVKVLSAVEVQRYERRALGLPLDEDEEGSKGEEERLSEADVSMDADEQEEERKETEDAAYLGEDDGAKQRLSSFSFGRRRQSTLKPPD